MQSHKKRAVQLDESDELSTLLFRITGPAHLPWQDPVWEDLLVTGAGVWVHVEIRFQAQSSSYTAAAAASAADTTTAPDHDGSTTSSSSSSSSSSVLERACQSLTRHAARTSNLAALAMHVTRLLRNVFPSQQQEPSSTSHKPSSSPSTPAAEEDEEETEFGMRFAQEIATVGRAKTTAGALNLFRILTHALILHQQQQESVTTREEDYFVNDNNSHHHNNDSLLREAFEYKSREGAAGMSMGGDHGRSVAPDLLDSMFQFLVLAGGGGSGESGGSERRRRPWIRNSGSGNGAVYDATVLTLQLWTVLLSTQLYRPLIMTSVQRMQQIQQQQQEEESEKQPSKQSFLIPSSLFSTGSSNKSHSTTTTTTTPTGAGYFWDVQWEQTRERQALEHASADLWTTATTTTTNSATSTTSTTQLYLWTPRRLLAVLWSWHTERPPPPPNDSIQGHHQQLAHQVASAAASSSSNSSRIQGGVGASASSSPGPDGMYESAEGVVQAAAPQYLQRPHDPQGGEPGGMNQPPFFQQQQQQQHPYEGGGGAPPTSLTLRRQSSSSSSSAKLILDATKGVLVFSSTIIMLPFRLVSLALGLWGLGGGSGRRGSGYDQVHKQHLLMQGGGPQRSRTKDVLWLTDSPLADLSSALLLLLTNHERANPLENNNSNIIGNGPGTAAAANANLGNPFRTELAALEDNRWGGGGTEDLSQRGGLDTSDSGMNGNTEGGGLPHLLGQPQSPIGYDDDGDKVEEEVILVGEGRQRTRSVSSTVSRGWGSPVLLLNFERLFAVFGATVHNEVGALLLYTLLQASPKFAEFVAVRSDLDTLVLPMLRTLYFATSSTRHYAGTDYLASGTTRGGGLDDSTSSAHVIAGRTPSAISIRACPFRSMSQLYVSIILLLLFSQDSSFGPDAFRRVHVPHLPWYKERHLKDISLGSVLLLSMLRLFTFTLNRLHDSFLLSNSCAILMNLAFSIVDLHDYAAMRLATVTLSVVKRYIKLRKGVAAAAGARGDTAPSGGSLLSAKVGMGVEEEEADLQSPLAQHGEVARTLLQIIKICLSPKLVERNIHLIYALVYLQADYRRLLTAKDCPFKKGETSRLLTVMTTASKLMEQHGDTRTAAKALKVLSTHLEEIRTAVSSAETPSRKRNNNNTADDFTFTYEEEPDPETFFVPYVWEVVVCAVTSSSLEWNKDRIRVFPLLDVIEDDNNGGDNQETSPLLSSSTFSQDVSDVV